MLNELFLRGGPVLYVLFFVTLIIFYILIDKYRFIFFNSEVWLKLKLSEFKKQYKLEFDLLSDSKKTMGELYDVNSFYFFPQRKTFLIDENGVLIRKIDSVDIDKHADEILALFDSKSPTK